MLKKVKIPDEEKAKGMVWVVYPVCQEIYKIDCEVELQIQQSIN